MGSVTTLPRSRPLMASDLAGMPDDGHRYEVVNGTLVVTPAPSDRHQAVVVRLIVLLSGAVPENLCVRTAPYDVVLAEDTLVQPDVLVARRHDVTERGLVGVPPLVVEVLSPSTALVDLSLKRARYEAAGVTSYWVVDPDLPGLTAWNLHDGRYVEVVQITGEQAWTTDHPFAVTVVPSELLD